nr:MAG TPA: hypothetical protein [Caudoviricetes sp.]
MWPRDVPQADPSPSAVSALGVGSPVFSTPPHPMAEVTPRAG